MLSLALSRQAALLGCAAALAAGTATAATRHVPAEYGTIQAGMDAAAVGDTVLVAPGVYTDCDGGPCLAKAVVVKEGVTLLSEGGPEVTTIRADNAAGTGSVVDARWLGLMGAEVRGFRITTSIPGRSGLSAMGSQRFVARDCTFEDLRSGIGHSAGGPGSYSLEVTNCVFRRCATESGIPGLFVLNVDAAVESCLFEDCAGGAIYMDGMDTQIGTVRNCTFRNTTAASALAGTDFKSLTVENCRFEANDARPNNGGGLGVFVSAGSALTIVDCVFLGNLSLGISGAASGTGSGVVRFEGNTVVRNEGGSAGAAVTLGGTITLRNNIIALTSGTGAAFRVLSGGSATGSCNVFWNNANGDYVNYTPDSTDTFVDPLFCDEEGGDLRLRPESPCLPENSNGCGRIGALDVGCGSVSVTQSTWARLKATFR